MSFVDTRRNAGRWRPISRHRRPRIAAGTPIRSIAWTSIAELPDREAFLVLSACSRAGIATFAGLREGTAARTRIGTYQIWVDSRHLHRAQAVAHHVLAAAHQPGHADG